MTNYYYTGEVIKLNHQDFIKWQQMYPYLDLVPELDQIDMEFQCRLREGGSVKKWFSETFARLNGRNKRAQNNRPKQQSISQGLNDRSWAASVKVIEGGKK